MHRLSVKVTLARALIIYSHDFCLVIAISLFVDCCTELEETDPIVEMQKYAFVLRVKTRRARDAATLECLLQEFEESSFLETSSVYPVLQLLVRLKDSNSSLAPITVNLDFQRRRCVAASFIVFDQLRQHRFLEHILLRRTESCSTGSSLYRRRRHTSVPNVSHGILYIVR